MLFTPIVNIDEDMCDGLMRGFLLGLKKLVRCKKQEIRRIEVSMKISTIRNRASFKFKICS